jgi:hypothetical protein
LAAVVAEQVVVFNPPQIVLVLAMDVLVALAVDLEMLHLV